MKLISDLVDSLLGGRESCRSDGNGIVETGAVGGDYAEIVVVRHGETEWNSDGRIQVLGPQLNFSISHVHGKIGVRCSGIKIA